jgi:hypothetical protein
MDSEVQPSVPVAGMPVEAGFARRGAESKFLSVLAKLGEVYLVYFQKSGKITIDLGNEKSAYTRHWFNPRQGGPLKPTGTTIAGGSKSTLTTPDNEDWLTVLRRA